MPQVKSVRLSVERVGVNRFRAVVDLDVITYPFGSVPVDVMVLVDGRPHSTKTVEVRACGRPPDQPCPGRAEFELELPMGRHSIEARARDHGDDKVYPDDFVRSLRPRERWVYYFYPVVSVTARGSTGSPRAITVPEKFAESVVADLWYYDWIDVRVAKWETAPCYPGFQCLKSVEWTGSFIYMINADETTEGVARRVAEWMRSRWGLEDSHCDACVSSVHRAYVG